MKFAHLSDCHIGGWREPKLRELGIRTFERAIETAIQERVGFVLIAGDLFDTALPQIELIKETASILSKLKEEDIPVYIIPGSHDYSASGKTMLDVLEKAGLVESAIRIEEGKLQATHDRTGTKIAGYHGRKGQLETHDYEKLSYEDLEKEEGYKIFMFHSLLNQMKGQDFEHIEGAELSILPKGFNYYAGGHPHFIKAEKFPNYGTIAYPGPTFPNNFKELEELKAGGMYIVDTDGQETNPRHVKIALKETLNRTINADNKTPEQVEREILEKTEDHKDKIITLRIEGTLKAGKPSDINFTRIQERLNQSYTVLKNTNKLKSPETEETHSAENRIEDIETDIIKKNLSKKIHNEEALINQLIQALDTEKEDGEKSQDFENRITKEAFQRLGITDA